MKFISDNRASRILYNFLASNYIARPFIVPSNVCEVIPEVFKEAGISVVFSDIDSKTLCLDFNWILDHISEYSGALFVHTYGIEGDFEHFFKIIKNSNPHFLIIDDRCLCTPVITAPNTFADLCVYSVGERKQVDLGIGGFAFIQDNVRYLFCKLKADSFLYDSIWSFDGNLVLNKTKEASFHRNTINTIYSNSLPKNIQFNEAYQNWRFNIYVNNKQRILDALFAKGLFASSHYKPLSATSNNAFWLHEHVINLFNDYHYSEEMARETCYIINTLI